MSTFAASVECGAISMFGRLEISEFCEVNEIHLERRQNSGEGEKETVINKGRW